ncbi:MAG: hypothetical protein ACFFC7_24490 [Candidatus Hermodarchaeota archaeon]
MNTHIGHSFGKRPLALEPEERIFGSTKSGIVNSNPHHFEQS